MRVRSKAPLMAVTAFMLSAAAPVAMAFSTTSDQVVVSTDRFGYSGSVTSTGTTYTFTSNGGNRDLALYIVQNRSNAYDFDINQIQTAWYYTIDLSGDPGEDNPSNVLEGFVQIVDEDSNTDTGLSGFWSSDRRTFTFSLQGKNATAVGDFARLWGADSSNDAGEFLDYSLQLTAQFANAATDVDNDGFFDISEDPSNVSGSFTGLFKNADNREYDFAFSLNMNSWATTNEDDLTGENNSRFASYFGSNTVVPEPGTLALLGLGFIGLAATRRRKVIG